MLPYYYLVHFHAVLSEIMLISVSYLFQGAAGLGKLRVVRFVTLRFCIFYYVNIPMKTNCSVGKIVQKNNLLSNINTEHTK